MSVRTIIWYLPCWVRFDITCGTSWHLLVVRVDMGRVDMGMSWLPPVESMIMTLIQRISIISIIIYIYKNIYKYIRSRYKLSNLQVKNIRSRYKLSASTIMMNKNVKVYSLISSISFDISHLYPPGHWTCSFVCHFNSTEGIQSWSHFGALNLLYTLSSLSFQLLIFESSVKWSIWGLSALSKDTTSKQCPNIERGDAWYFSKNPVPSRIWNRTAGSCFDNVQNNISEQTTAPSCKGKHQ